MRLSHDWYLSGLRWKPFTAGFVHFPSEFFFHDEVSPKKAVGNIIQRHWKIRCVSYRLGLGDLFWFDDCFTDYTMINHHFFTTISPFGWIGHFFSKHFKQIQVHEFFLLYTTHGCWFLTYSFFCASVFCSSILLMFFSPFNRIFWVSIDYTYIQPSYTLICCVSFSILKTS